MRYVRIAKTYAIFPFDPSIMCINDEISLNNLLIHVLILKFIIIVNYLKI